MRSTFLATCTSTVLASRPIGKRGRGGYASLLNKAMPLHNTCWAICGHTAVAESYRTISRKISNRRFGFARTRSETTRTSGQSTACPSPDGRLTDLQQQASIDWQQNTGDVTRFVRGKKHSGVGYVERIAFNRHGERDVRGAFLAHLIT